MWVLASVHLPTHFHTFLIFFSFNSLIYSLFFMLKNSSPSLSLPKHDLSLNCIGALLFYSPSTILPLRHTSILPLFNWVFIIYSPNLNQRKPKGQNPFTFSRLWFKDEGMWLNNFIFSWLQKGFKQREKSIWTHLLRKGINLHNLMTSS